MQKIGDYGNKIEGAKKDLYNAGVVTFQELEDPKLRKIGEKITKNNVWEKLDYYALVHQEGVPKEVVYFKKLIHDRAPTKPLISEASASSLTIEKANEIVKNYISFLNELELDMQSIQTVEDCENYGRNVFFKKYYNLSRTFQHYPKKQYELLINNQLLKALRQSQYSLRKSVERRKLWYTEEEKILSNFDYFRIDYKTMQWKTKKGKFALERPMDGFVRCYFPTNVRSEEDGKKQFPDHKIFVFDHLENDFFIAEQDSLEEVKMYLLNTGKLRLEKENKLNEEHKKRTPKPKEILKKLKRKGKPIREKNLHVQKSSFKEMFKINDYQFGNSLSETERAMHLDLSYDALTDLSDLLQIDCNDIGLNNLKLAYGARGDGGVHSAAAHYESNKKVINLTRNNGAGCLAHEWFHAFDNYLPTFYGVKGKYLSETIDSYKEEFPAFYEMIDTLLYRYTTKEESFQEKRKEITDKKEAFSNELTKDIQVLCNDLNRNDLLEPSWMDEIRDDIHTVLERVSNLENLPYRSEKTCELFHSFDDEMKPYMLPEMKELAEKLDETLHTDFFTSHLDSYGSELNSLYKPIAYLREKEKDFKPIKVKSNYYKKSIFLDSLYRGNSYYAQKCEMFARAGAAYLAMKAKSLDRQNDYLLKDALQTHYEPSIKETLYFYPTGDEMERFGKCFEKVIEELKEKEIFHEPTHSYFLEKPYKKYSNENLFVYEGKHFEQITLKFGESFKKDLEAMNDFHKYTKEEFLDKYPNYTEDDYDTTVVECMCEENEKKRDCKNDLCLSNR